MIKYPRWIFAMPTKAPHHPDGSHTELYALSRPLDGHIFITAGWFMADISMAMLHHGKPIRHHQISIEVPRHANQTPPPSRWVQYRTVCAVRTSGRPYFQHGRMICGRYGRDYCAECTTCGLANAVEIKPTSGITVNNPSSYANRGPIAVCFCGTGL